MGLAYNEELYNSIIDACCLRHDLDSLLHGDATEIGEKGVNLSGTFSKQLNNKLTENKVVKKHVLHLQEQSTKTPTCIYWMIFYQQWIQQLQITFSKIASWYSWPIKQGTFHIY